MSSDWPIKLASSLSCDGPAFLSSGVSTCPEPSAFAQTRQSFRSVMRARARGQIATRCGCRRHHEEHRSRRTPRSSPVLPPPLLVGPRPRADRPSRRSLLRREALRRREPEAARCVCDDGYPPFQFVHVNLSCFVKADGVTRRRNGRRRRGPPTGWHLDRVTGVARLRAVFANSRQRLCVGAPFAERPRLRSAARFGRAERALIGAERLRWMKDAISGAL